jgi:hypothetical protein
LEKILRAETGKEEGKGFEGKGINNRIAFGATVRMLKDKTGQDKVALKDVYKPTQAIKQAQK